VNGHATGSSEEPGCNSVHRLQFWNWSSVVVVVVQEIVPLMSSACRGAISTPGIVKNFREGIGWKRSSDGRKMDVARRVCRALSEGRGRTQSFAKRARWRVDVAASSTGNHRLSAVRRGIVGLGTCWVDSSKPQVLRSGRSMRYEEWEVCFARRALESERCLVK
jgi:hypothetical protein